MEKKVPRLLSPYEALHNLKDKIKKEWKIAFLSAVIIGLATHLFFIAQLIVNHDSLLTLDIPQDAILTGRWFLKYICGVNSNFILPTVIGITSLIAMGLSSVIVVNLFDVKKTLNIILISAIMVTYPTVASTFSYMFLADGYFIALLLATLSVLLASKYKYGFLLGAVCICFSLGIYQAYISVTIILCILKLLYSMITDKQPKGILKQSLKYLAMGILGFVLYYIILQIMLYVREMNLSSYQNVDSLGSLSLNSLLSGAVFAYKNFYNYIINTSFHKSNIIIIISNILVGAGLAFLFIKEYINKKAYKKTFNNVLLVVLLIIIPIGLNIVNLLSTETRYHMVMRYSWCLLYVAFIILLDKVEIKAKIVQWLGVLSLICIVYNFIIVDNVAYYNAYFKFEKTYAVTAKLSERIENFEGYNINMPVAIIGTPDKSKYPSTNTTKEITNDITGTDGDMIASKTTHYKAFLEKYFNLKIIALNTSETEKIQATDEFKNMPTYPDKDSMKIIDGVLVVKLSK